MKDLLRTRWLLFLVLVVFIICKLPHLTYPYYWDECWPYATAIKWMCDHTISIMPTALDPELSRGHPLFFHVIAASWMRIFGNSHVSMHSFALLIAVLFLIAIYEAGFRLFNQRVASLALLLIAAQVVFYVQSSFVLFELLIAFLGFVSIYFYSTGRYLLTGICLSMLFFTKESGLIAGFVIGVDAIVGFFSKHRSAKDKWQAIAAIGVPCLLIGSFFLIQKHVRGWYVFPLYAGIVEHNWDAFWYKFRMGTLKDSLYQNYKYRYGLILILLSVVAAIKNKKLGYLALLFPAFCIYYFVDDMRAGRLFPSRVFFIVFICSIICFLLAYARTSFYALVAQRRFLVLMVSFIFCFIIFSTMNFYTYRYVMAAIFPFLFIIAVLADLLVARTYPVLYYPVVAVALTISFFSFKKNDSNCDTDLGAYETMVVQQSMVTYMEQTKDYDAQIGCGSYLNREHLIDSSTGFLHSGQGFKKVVWDMDEKTRYAIFDNIEEDGGRYNALLKDTSFSCVFRFQKGKEWVAILKRKQPTN